MTTQECRIMAVLRLQVARRIRHRRDKLGLTQAQLAERCGMDAARISDAERGKGRLLVATLERIAGGLGVGMMYFFRIDSRRHPA